MDMTSTTQKADTDEKKDYLTKLLSDEILVKIFRQLPTNDDILRLSQTCSRLEKLLRDKTFNDSVCIPWFSQIGRASFSKFFKDKVRAQIITRLDFSDLYWIPSGIIRDLVVQMVNLETLLSAGTTLSWTHLAQLLKSLTIKKLSWSWDNDLEESCRRRGSLIPGRFSELTEMKDDFLKLNALMVHIPMIPKHRTDVLFYSYSALEYLISLCTNVEALWLISWPKTMAEKKLSSGVNLNQSRMMTELSDMIRFNNLHTLVVSVKTAPRFSSINFLVMLVKSFRQVNPDAAQVCWLDHPFLGHGSRSFWRSGNRPFGSRLDASSNAHFWGPQMCSETAMQFTYPLTAIPEIGRCNYPKLKHVLVCQGKPIVVNLNGFLDNSPDLESFCCSAFNFKMNWNMFTETHPKLKAVSICETEGNEDYSEALSKLTELENLSVSVNCLYEIRDEYLLKEYSTLRQLDSKTESDAGNFDVRTTPHSSFKKRRLVENHLNPPGAETVTGFHFVAKRCSKITELEIGYGEPKMAKAGRLLPDSLFYISKFKLLRKLSLSSIPISNGGFLIKICINCDIESLRLTHLGPTAKCCYIQDLCRALTHCKKLKDLRLEQNYLGSPLPVLTALSKYCSNLRRLLICSSPNDKPLEYYHVDELFRGCPKLVMFYATIESTTKVNCIKIKKAIEASYKSERPGLSIVLRRTSEEEELINYPSIHYRQMVVNQTQVCQFNDFQKFNR